MLPRCPTVPDVCGMQTLNLVEKQVLIGAAVWDPVFFLTARPKDHKDKYVEHLFVSAAVYICPNACSGGYGHLIVGLRMPARFPRAGTFTNSTIISMAY